MAAPRTIVCRASQVRVSRSIARDGGRDDAPIHTEASMADTQKKAEIVSRTAVIVALREELGRRAGTDMSFCRLAALMGILCKGFRRYSDAELEQRFGWIARKNPDATREELEELADRWQLARQEALGAKTSCDVQQLEHDTCGGWEDFSNDDLTRALRQLTGRLVTISA